MATTTAPIATTATTAPTAATATTTLDLKISKAASGSGGDKYLIVSDSERERFIYVPQTISRKAGRPLDSIQFKIYQGDAPPPGSIGFSLVKQAKGSGDDRYTATDQAAWKGDIYLKGFGTGALYLSLV